MTAPALVPNVQPPDGLFRPALFDMRGDVCEPMDWQPGQLITRPWPLASEPATPRRST